MKKSSLLFFYLLLTFFLFGKNNYDNNDFITKEYFGLHIHDGIDQRRPWPNVTFDTWRLWDIGMVWVTLEPSDDEWNLHKLDKAIRTAEEKGISLLVTLGQTPTWCAAKPYRYSPYGKKDSTTRPPKDIKYWEDYIRTIATKYKGKIKYWELWNEPDLYWFYSGTIKEMVNLYKVAYAIIKSINPESIVLSPPIASWGGGLLWLNSFLRQGGKNYIDGIDFHYYTGKFITPESLKYHILSIKRIRKRNNISNKPIFNSEGGANNNLKFSYKKAGYLARMYINQFAYGVSKFIWYAWDNGNIGTMVNSKDFSINKTGIAYREIQKWLIGKKITDLKQKAGRIFVCTLIDKIGKKYKILWTLAKKKTFSLQEVYNFSKIRHLDGKVSTIINNKVILSNEPILLE